MRFHGTAVARDDHGVLILGSPGAGKSRLALALAGLGYMLVADDQVVVEAGFASPPPAIRGLIEVRGLGILRRPYRPRARLRLAVRLAGVHAPRLPKPARFDPLNLPVLNLESGRPDAAAVVDLMLEGVLDSNANGADGLAPAHAGTSCADARLS